MKRPTILTTVFVGVVLLAVVFYFLWPTLNGGPLLRLKIVGRAVENGREVVFFRLEGEGQRRVIITDVHQISGVTWQAPLWASQGPPLNDVSKGRKQFGVLAPKNISVWKETTWRLQATVLREERKTFMLFPS